jgi:hypothetical protein
MEGILEPTITFHINKYAKNLGEKLGMDEDDLLNDVREQIWKGLLSHDKSKPASEYTYLSFIIANRFKTLAKRSSLPKHNCVQYYADVYSASGIEEEDLIDNTTGEALLEARQQLAIYLSLLNETDREIYGFLVHGYSLDEMVTTYNKLHKAPGFLPVNRVFITGIINRVQETIVRQRKLTP